MGGASVGDIRTDYEIELEREFKMLLRRVIGELQDGSIEPRQGRVGVYKKTAWRVRGWWLRRTHIIEDTAGVWASFGIQNNYGLDENDSHNDPDDYDIFFVSSNGIIGKFLGYRRDGGCYILAQDGVNGEDTLERWNSGFKTLLGLSALITDGYPAICTNPV